MGNQQRNSATSSIRCLRFGAQSSRRFGIALKQSVLGLGIKRRCRFVQHQQYWLLAHEPARQGKLLPLTKTNLDAARPGWAQLRVEPSRKPVDNIVGAGARDGTSNCRPVLETQNVTQTDRIARLKFEAEKILKSS